jgi:hypothetical protein
MTMRAAKIPKIVVVVTVMATTLLLAIPVYADTPPIVDGALFGPGEGGSADINTYTYLKNVMIDNAWVYHYLDTGPDPDVYYVAVILNPNYADNVFDAHDHTGQKYMTDVGWTKNRSFKEVVNSDQLGEAGYITFECGTNSYSWRQDHIDWGGGPSGPCQADPTSCTWTSDVVAGGTPPPGIDTDNSMVWNMNNTSWNVKVSEGTNTDNWAYWKSPDGLTPADSTDSSPIDPSLGYGSTWYDSTNEWEWLTVYEMSFPVGQCTGGPEDWMFNVQDAHASPEKEGWTGCSGDITIVKDTICGPDCFDDTGNFGYDFLDLANPPAVEFWLDDPATDDGDGITNSETFDLLDIGTYEVTEDVFPYARWYVQNIYCNADALVQIGSASNGFDGDFDAGDDTVRIELRYCESVQCTFVNEDPGTTDVGIASLAASSGAGGLAALLGMAGLLGTAAAGLRAKRRS